MADIHTLARSDEGNVRCVFHIATPAGNNAVGVSWVTALVNSGVAGVSLLSVGAGPGQIDAAEAAAVSAGTIIEVSFDFPLESGGTSNADRLASLRAFYLQQTTMYLQRLQARLKYFGATAAAV